MRKALVGLLSVCLLALFVGAVSARDTDKDLRFMQMPEIGYDPALIDQGLHGLQMSSASVDTYILVWYDFDGSCEWQGWQQWDWWSQYGEFWHADDFLGLEAYDRLEALDGDMSMWCGLRPLGDPLCVDDDWSYKCSWQKLPGYGTNWAQMLWTEDPIYFQGALTIEFLAAFDSEPDWDYTYLQYDKGGFVGAGGVYFPSWETIDRFTGVHAPDTYEYTIFLAQVATKLRFHFSSDGAYDDQDGDYPSQGAAIIDNIKISDAATGQIDFEDFESATRGDKVVGIWRAGTPIAYGIHSALYANLIDFDECATNPTCQAIFYEGSEVYSVEYDAYETPFCKGPGGIANPCQAEIIYSPVIEVNRYSTQRNHIQDADIPASEWDRLAAYHLWFTVYGDLPLDNLVFYTWHLRNIRADGCELRWLTDNFVYYAPDRFYRRNAFSMGARVESDRVQVGLGIRDMCYVWYTPPNRVCDTHTPAPYFDNISLIRSGAAKGPTFIVRDIDLFQDAFPSDDNDLESFCRADCALDILPYTSPYLKPGDSIFFSVTAPLSGGLDTLHFNLPAVYAHVKAEYKVPADGGDRCVGTVTHPKPQYLAGATLGGTVTNNLGTVPAAYYISDDGVWTVFLCPPAMGASGETFPNRFMFDLNDQLFTRGYEVEYYFKAYAKDATSATLPGRAEDPLGRRYEMTFLPSCNTPVLFVDDFDGRGSFDGLVQSYFDPAFAAVLTEMPDRYDVRGPSSMVGNGLARYGFPVGPRNTLKKAYGKIVWDPGELSSGTIGAGNVAGEKTDDCSLLDDWLKTADRATSLWVLGNNTAMDLATIGVPGMELMLTCGVGLASVSYFGETGETTPLVEGQAANFPLGAYNGFDGLQYYAFGGCPVIRNFDVLETVGPEARVVFEYSDDYPAAIARWTTNNLGHPMRTVWHGHSIRFVRDAHGQTGPQVRSLLVEAVWNFFENDTSEDITDSETPLVYSLAQNFPNPFNPSTRISFTLPVKGHVNLRIYDVAGRLVKTLADGVMDQGSHQLTWDGTNNRGSSVASGVYFYKLTAGGQYENMKKMVLLR